MNRSKPRVLIDAHNLALPYGTGIKTYGLTLLAALRRLEWDPDLLVSAHWNTDPRVARALLQDIPLQPIDGIDVWDEWWRQLLNRPRQAETVPSQKELPLPTPETIFPYGLGCSVSPFLYEHALAIQERLDHPIQVRTKKRYDLYHATMPLPLQVRDLRCVTTIHDLIPLLQPQTCPAHRASFSAQIKLAIRQSTVLAAVSEHTKRELITHFDVAEEKVVVTHQPTLLENWAGHPRLREGYLRQWGLTPGGYILFRRKY